MNKKLKTAGITVGILGVFGVGGLVGKTATDWQTNAINEANRSIGKVGYDTTGVIAKNINGDVQDTINSALSDTLDGKSDELQRLLEQYYKMRLEGVTDSPEYRAVEMEIEKIFSGSLSRFKKEIDDLFANQK